MDILLCPNCRSFLVTEKNAMICNQCNHEYPVHDDIGILVPNANEHLKYIQSKIDGKTKDWYVSNQIESYDKGSYRHHILKRIQFVKSIIESHMKGNNQLENILDLGCGDGANLRWLSKYTPNLWATDYNLDRLEKASKLVQQLGVNVKLYLADIRCLPFANESFDIVFFNHVIEHLDDDFLALQNIYRTLKNKGLLILGTPNEGALAWRFAYAVEPRVKKRTDHLNFYTAKSISALAQKAGFKVKQIEFMGWGLPVWSIDPLIRKYKIMDDIFEFVGKKIAKNQATSLYIMLEK